jgi:dihydrofolate reductase
MLSLFAVLLLMPTLAQAQKVQKKASARGLVTAEDIAKYPHDPIERIIARKVPGVEVVRAPGGGNMLRIRGAMTLPDAESGAQADKAPLYVVDGVAIRSADGALPPLEPQDIDSSHHGDMPRIRYRVAMSLDGYIAGPRGELDWIVQYPAIDFSALLAQFDTFLLGRKTYELTLQPGAPGFPAGSRAFVFSRTLPDQVPGFSVVRDVSQQSVEPIRAQATKDVWLFGGGELFRSFMALGLVDTIEVAVMPVLLGQGLPLLPQPAGQARLQLTGQRTYPSGIVLLEYNVMA